MKALRANLYIRTRTAGGSGTHPCPACGGELSHQGYRLDGNVYCSRGCAHNGVPSNIYDALDLTIL